MELKWGRGGGSREEGGKGIVSYFSVFAGIRLFRVGEGEVFAYIAGKNYNCMMQHLMLHSLDDFI